MQQAGDAVFIINASLLMGRENIMKEAEVFGTVLEGYARLVEEAGMQMSLHDVEYEARGKDQRYRHQRADQAAGNHGPGHATQ